MSVLFLNRPHQVKVVGNVASEEFHAARLYVQEECQRHPDKFCEPIIKPLVETDWAVYLSEERARLGAVAWRISRPVIVYVDDLVVGDSSEFVERGSKPHGFEQEDWEREMRTFYEDYVFSFGRTVVFMDITLDNERAGRLLFMLYSDKLPKTCENFRSLCEGGRREEEPEKAEVHKGDDEEEEGGERDEEKERKGEEEERRWEAERRSTRNREANEEGSEEGGAEDDDSVHREEGLCADGGEEEGGVGRKHKMCYKGSSIHRVVKGGWIQGGVTDSEDREPLSTFPDESFCIPFNRRGVLAMVQDRHHTNSTQFMVTLQPTPWMRCRYVAFGQLIEGLEVLDAIERVDTHLESPLKSIVISDCGALERQQASLPEENGESEGEGASLKLVRSAVADFLSSRAVSCSSDLLFRSDNRSGFGSTLVEEEDPDAGDERLVDAEEEMGKGLREAVTMEESEVGKAEDTEGDKSNDEPINKSEGAVTTEENEVGKAEETEDGKSSGEPRNKSEGAVTTEESEVGKAGETEDGKSSDKPRNV